MKHLNERYGAIGLTAENRAETRRNGYFFKANKICHEDSQRCKLVGVQSYKIFLST
ncbi:hypothetical protein Hanom_Chr04g00360911 [Helianthus anomalus]